MLDNYQKVYNAVVMKCRGRLDEFLGQNAVQTQTQTDRHNDNRQTDRQTYKRTDNWSVSESTMACTHWYHRTLTHGVCVHEWHTWWVGRSSMVHLTSCWLHVVTRTSCTHTHTHTGCYHLHPPHTHAHTHTHTHTQTRCYHLHPPHTHAHTHTHAFLYEFHSLHKPLCEWYHDNNVTRVISDVKVVITFTDKST